MIALALLQVVAAGPVLPEERVRVMPATCRERAAETGGEDIVICAAPSSEFRLKKLPQGGPADAAALPQAETSIFDGKAKIAGEGEQAGVGGFPSNRAMIRLKVPF